MLLDRSCLFLCEFTSLATGSRTGHEKQFGPFQYLHYWPQFGARMSMWPKPSQSESFPGPSVNSKWGRKNFLLRYCEDVSLESVSKSLIPTRWKQQAHSSGRIQLTSREKNSRELWWHLDTWFQIFLRPAHPCPSYIWKDDPINSLFVKSFIHVQPNQFWLAQFIYNGGSGIIPPFPGSSQEG